VHLARSTTLLPSKVIHFCTHSLPLNDPTSIQQIDEWRALKSETEHVEFKAARNTYDYQQLCEYCVAISNEGGGVLILGVEDKLNPTDKLRPVVGTNAFPKASKTARKLFDRLKFRIDVNEIQHPGGRVLVFRIPTRPVGEARHLDGRYWMRIGESVAPGTPEWLRNVASEKEANNGRRYITFGLVAALLLAVIMFLVKDRKSTPDAYLLSLDFLVLSGDHRNPNAYWWIGFPKQGEVKATVYPANIAMLLSVTNQRSTPVLIKRYQIEMRTNRDAFVPLDHLSTVGVVVYVGESRNSLSPILDPTPLLDRVIAQHQIGPGEMARGYALFQYPKDDGARFVHQFRMRIVDYSNTNYVSRTFEAEPRGEIAQPGVIAAGAAISDFKEANIEFETEKTND
jgi:hypothetical protein